MATMKRCISFFMLVCLYMGLTTRANAQGQYTNSVMRCVWRNASDDQRWMYGGNVVTERNEAAPINILEAGRPGGEGERIHHRQTHEDADVPDEEEGPGVGLDLTEELSGE